MTAPFTTTVPATLNGYPVVAFSEHANGYATIMVDRSNGEGDTPDLVVATWWPELKSGWSWGHYDLRSYRDADRVFKDVAARNTKRG